MLPAERAQQVFLNSLLDAQESQTVQESRGESHTLRDPIALLTALQSYSTVSYLGKEGTEGGTN